ncbi:MAG: hypothetical protein ACKOCM_11215 [Cyanobacteriota bacterium]
MRSDQDLQTDRSPLSVQRGGGNHPEQPLASILRIHLVWIPLIKQTENVQQGAAMIDLKTDHRGYVLFSELHISSRSDRQTYSLFGDGNLRSFDSMVSWMDGQSLMDEPFCIGMADLSFQQMAGIPAQESNKIIHQPMSMAGPWIIVTG